MATPNDRLRDRREATPSPNAPGESMSRAELAEAVNAYLWETAGKRLHLDAHTIARYERGAVRWPSAAYRSGLRAVLHAATDVELGFRPTRRGNTRLPSQAIGTPQKTPDHRGRVDLGANPQRFLDSITVERSVPTRLGWTEVEHIRATTREVALTENLFGGGLSCETATAHLRWAGRLLEVQATNEVHDAIAEAIGNLASVVAFSAFDIGNYAVADRCFDFSLWCANEGGSWALRANTLAEMARKAAYLGDLDDALELIEFAQVRSDRLTATARAMLSTLRARLLALTGRHAEAQADVGRADENFADRTSVADPPWLCYYDGAEHQGSTGKALIPIAEACNTPELAASRLEAAIRLQGAEYPRSRTFSRIRLASLLMRTGNPQTALPIGRQAAVDTAAMRSARLSSELLDLARAAEDHGRIDEVADLRHDIINARLPMT